MREVDARQPHTVRARGAGTDSHVRSIDGLRFLSFLGVFGFHAFQNNVQIDRLTRYGTLGIQVFFVLSGFLVGGGLLQLRQATHVPIGGRLRSFYARRSLRIFPIYYLTLLVLLTIEFAGIASVGGSDLLPWNLTYTTNIKMFLDGEVTGGLSHLWTLSVEEQFYLLVPLLMLWTSTRVVSWVCVAGVVLASVGRVAFQLQGVEFGWVLSPMQFDCMFIGIAGAILLAEGHFLGLDRQRLQRVVQVAAVVAVPVFVCWQFSGRRARIVGAALDNPVLSLVVAGLIVGLWTSSFPRIAAALSSWPLPYLGRISYALYLFHLPVLVLCSAEFDFVTSGVAVPAFGLTVLLAMLSWRYVEAPMNRRKSHFALPAAPAVDRKTQTAPTASG